MNLSLSVKDISQPEAKEFWDNNLKLHAQAFLGDAKARLVNAFDSPKTIVAVAAELDRSYHAIRENVVSLYNKGILVRSDYLSQKGHVYATNYVNLLNFVASTQTGMLLMSQHGFELSNTLKYDVNRSTIFDSFPTPQHPVLELKLGNEATDVFKFIIAARELQSRYVKLLYNASLLMYHVWYRNYLLTTEGISPEALIGPTANEARACMRGLSNQIKQYGEMLDQLTANELIWSETPNFEAWRSIGDLPLQWAKEGSQTVINAWAEGIINTQGRPGRLITDYENQKAELERAIAEQWIAHRNAMSEHLQEPS